MPGPNAPQHDWPLAPGQPGREVWYSLVTHPERDLGFWYRYTLLSTESGHREGRLWAALTDRENPERSCFLSRSVAPDDVGYSTDPFLLVLDDGEQTHRGAHGHIGANHDRDGDDIDVAWQFSYAPDSETYSPLRSRRLTNLLARFAGGGKHWSVNQSVRMDGTLRLGGPGGERIEFDDAPGHQGHTLSSHPPEKVTWVHCNAFDDPSVALEALYAGGMLSLCLRRDGEVHALNRLKHVVGPWANETTHVEPGEWRFEGSGEGISVSVRVGADEDHWQRVAYRAPDDTLRYNAHCSLSSVELSYDVTDGPTRTLAADAGRAEWVTAEKPIPGEYRPAWDV